MSTKLSQQAAPKQFTHQVIAQYQIGQYAQGQLISQHTSYELARKAAKRAGDHFTAIREIATHPA